MSISGHHTAHGPAAVLAEVRDRVVELAETLWASQPDGELVGVVEEIQRLKSTLSAVEADAVAEVDARQVPKRVLHYGSTADWLTHAGGLRRFEGHRLVRRAVALTGPLQCTREQLVAGRLSAEQVDEIVRAVADLPGVSDVRHEAERALLDHATTLDAGELRKAGRHLVTVLDPDGEERRLEAQLERDERAAHVDRYLSITDDGAGGVRVRGRGSVEDGAIWKAVILPLTCPRPAVDEADGGGPLYDPRDHGARAWDAAVTVFQHALDTQLVPDSHRAPARLIIRMTREPCSRPSRRRQGRARAWG